MFYETSNRAIWLVRDIEVWYKCKHMYIHVHVQCHGGYVKFCVCMCIMCSVCLYFHEWSDSGHGGSCALAQGKRYRLHCSTDVLIMLSLWLRLYLLKSLFAATCNMEIGWVCSQHVQWYQGQHWNIHVSSFTFWAWYCSIEKNINNDKILETVHIEMIVLNFSVLSNQQPFTPEQRTVESARPW